MVVESRIVVPNEINFYLQSLASPKGTARSAHYVVLQDKATYSLKDLQSVVSYTGSRATNALSVCTPAWHADLVCDRMRCYMKPALDGKYPLITGRSANFQDILKKREEHDYETDEFIWNQHA